jgi:hypothetical protein
MQLHKDNYRIFPTKHAYANSSLLSSENDFRQELFCKRFHFQIDDAKKKVLIDEKLLI